MIEAPVRIAEVARNYRFHGLYIKNFIISALLILLPLMTLNIFLYGSMRRLATNEAAALSLNTLHKTRDIFDAIFKEGEYLAASIALQAETEVYALRENFDSILTADTVRTLAANLKTAVYSNAYIHTIYVFSASSLRLVTHIGENELEGFLDSSWYTTYLDIGENKIYKVVRRINDNYPNVISLIKPLYLFGPDKKYGAIVINFDVDQLRPVLLDPDPSSPEDLYVIDEDGSILFSNHAEDLGKKADPGKLAFVSNSRDVSVLDSGREEIPRIVSVSQSRRYPWSFLSYHALGSYTLQSSRLQSFMTLVFVVSLVATFIAAFLISASSYQPIKRILGALEHPERTQLLQKSGSGRLSNETKYIASTIARFAHTNQELSEELNRQLSLLDRTRVAALQAQINPHFVNNTLEAISMSARRLSGGDNHVVSMISLLSQLLKIGLDASNNIVPLAEEVEYAKLYLEILSIRYQGRFEVEWNIDETLLRVAVLKLCLQPLLENAFYHGIKPARQKGWIRVDIDKVGSEMFIRVVNSGAGIPAQSLRNLNRSLSGVFEISGEHVGMRNVNQRIKLIFGSDYGISIESGKSKGTVVIMRFPVVSESLK